MERKSIGEWIKEQILDLVATFEDGLGLGQVLGKKLAHDSKAAVLQQNSKKAVKKYLRKFEGVDIYYNFCVQPDVFSLLLCGANFNEI